MKKHNIHRVLYYVINGINEREREREREPGERGNPGGADYTEVG